VIGKIEYFNAERLFGFIRREGGTSRASDCFFHLSAVDDQSSQLVAVGARVEFDVVESDGKKPRAENVRVI
jgi:cold shock CspA family protein